MPLVLFNAKHSPSNPHTTPTNKAHAENEYQDDIPDMNIVLQKFGIISENLKCVPLAEYQWHEFDEPPSKNEELENNTENLDNTHHQQEFDEEFDNNRKNYKNTDHNTEATISQRIREMVRLCRTHKAHQITG